MNEEEKKKEYFKSTLESANQNVFMSRRQAEHVTFVISAGSLTLLVGVFENFTPSAVCEKIVLTLSAILAFSALLIYLRGLKHSAAYNSVVVSKLFDWQNDNYRGGFFLPDDDWWPPVKKDFSYAEDRVATFLSVLAALILITFIIYKIFT